MQSSQMKTKETSYAHDNAVASKGLGRWKCRGPDEKTKAGPHSNFVAPLHQIGAQRAF